MKTIRGGGAFTYANISDINANFAQVLSLAIGLGGNIIWCNPAVGVDALADGSQEKPYGTITSAYGKGRSGKNDVVVLVGTGAAGGSARLTATLTWAKDALHLIGFASPVVYSQRARIAPTSAATAFTPFITISGNGCIFQNIQFFGGFTTGTTSQICMNLTGGRNYFLNCAIDGMADNESAQSPGSRTVVIGAGGENVFDSCSLGVDTITRTQANATVEFAGGTPRNVFRNCYFPFQTSAAGVLGVLGTGAACMDRHQVFESCQFVNNIKSSSTIMTVLGSLTSASPGGLLLYTGYTTLVGITDYGDTNGLANSYIRQSGATAATEGIAINPT